MSSVVPVRRSLPHQMRTTDCGWGTSKDNAAGDAKSDCLLFLRPLVKCGRVFGVMPVTFTRGKMSFQWKSPPAAYAVTVATVLSVYATFKVLMYVWCLFVYGSGNPEEFVENIFENGNCVEKDEANLQQNLRPSANDEPTVISPEILARSDSSTEVPETNEGKLRVPRRQDDMVEVIQTCIFYCFGASGAVLLLRAAPVFVNLCDIWCRVEREVLGGEGLGRRWPLFLGLGLLAASAVWETCASMIYRVQSTLPFWSFLETHIKNGHIEAVHIMGYSKPLGILLLMVNKLATFVWNFGDLFIATIAYVLARHFKAFNEKLNRKYQGSAACGEGWWRKAREQHLALQGLVWAADAVTGPLVLQSFVCNLFFMLVQLYNGLRPHYPKSNIERIYLAWSFLHLLCRLLFVSFSCASLHTLTLEPTTLLLSLPTESVNTEVERFMKQLVARSVGLTGCGFFFVNKSFILATTGALITYEVILLQLNPS